METLIFKSLVNTIFFCKLAEICNDISDVYTMILAMILAMTLAMSMQ